MQGNVSESGNLTSDRLVYSPIYRKPEILGSFDQRRVKCTQNI